MKTITAIIATAFVLSSCNAIGKKGNGNVTIEDRTVSSFTRLSIEGVFPVELSQDGSREWVKVETDENLQEFVVIKNDGDELKIEMKDKPNVRKSTKIKVYVNVKNLSEINFNSIGNLTSNGKLSFDSVELNTEAVGKLNLDLDAEFLRANLNSVGTTTLSGNVFEARINNKSVGALNAYDLKTKVLMIHNVAVGAAEVYADSIFHIRSSAIGTLKYKGAGQVVELKSEGVGKVEKEE